MPFAKRSLFSYMMYHPIVDYLLWCAIPVDIRALDSDECSIYPLALGLCFKGADVREAQQAGLARRNDTITEHGCEVLKRFFIVPEIFDAP